MNTEARSTAGLPATPSAWPSPRDAVVIATPDHWHTPAAILALDAGKHVYVEKPCSHNIREGRWLLDAARRAKRVVQIGTQSRSSEHVRRAMERLRDGVIGDVLVAKAWNSQLRGNIGHAQPSNPPAHLDYDLWSLGGAQSGDRLRIGTPADKEKYGGVYPTRPRSRGVRESQLPEAPGAEYPLGECRAEVTAHSEFPVRPGRQ